MMATQSVSKAVLLSELMHGLTDLAVSANVIVKGVSIDSRQVGDGYLFIAYQGTSVNGCDYIENAIKAGAVAIVWDAVGNVVPMQVARYLGERSAVQIIPVTDLRRHAGEIASRFYGNPSASMNVIGVTGTNGKTSCSHFLSQVLNKTSSCGLIGTLGYGLVDELTDIGMTTPDPVTLQLCLSELEVANASNVVMEVSSHALDQDRISGTHINVAVFTNLSRDHLDYHGDMQAYGQAKKKLFDLQSVEIAVVNLDDEFGRQLADSLVEGKRCITYGLTFSGTLPDVYASAIDLHADGMDITLQTRWGTGSLHSELLGRFNVSNLLAVAAVLLASEYDFEEVLKLLAEIKSVPGRMQHYGGDENATIVIDYAHTPDALDQVLATLREHCSGDLWCVFGCGGDRDKGKRSEMGEIAARYADRIIVTDDNPRFESAGMIVDDILQGTGQSKKVDVIHDRSRAIEKAVADARVGDVVLVAGKGHELYQVIADNRIPFSDHEQVLYQIRARKNR